MYCLKLFLSHWGKVAFDAVKRYMLPGLPGIRKKHLLPIWIKTNNIALPDFIHNRPGPTNYGISKSKHD